MFRTELGHIYIYLVECSVIALCLPVMSQLPVINSCAINRTMLGMSIKRISVLNLCHVLKPFVKSTPALHVVQARIVTIYVYEAVQECLSRYTEGFQYKVSIS